MYQISTRVDGVQRTIDLHDLYLPSENAFCHRLDRETLYKVLLKLKVPGIEKHHGHQDLSFKFGLWRLTQIEQAEAAEKEATK